MRLQVHGRRHSSCGSPCVSIHGFRFMAQKTEYVGAHGVSTICSVYRTLSPCNIYKIFLFQMLTLQVLPCNSPVTLLRCVLNVQIIVDKPQCWLSRTSTTPHVTRNIGRNYIRDPISAPSTLHLRRKFNSTSRLPSRQAQKLTSCRLKCNRNTRYTFAATT